MTAPIAQLADVAMRIEKLQEDIPRLVDECRQEGASWALIGRALGTTRQAAQQRYGPKPDATGGDLMTDPLFEPPPAPA